MFNDILPAYLALEVVQDIIMLLSVVQKNIEKGKNQNYKAHGLNSGGYGKKSSNSDNWPIHHDGLQLETFNRVMMGASQAIFGSSTNFLAI